MTYANAEITQIRAPKMKNGLDDDLGKSFAENRITFNPVGHLEGTYTYRVAFGNVSAVVSIIVREPVTNNLSEAASYRIVPVNGNVTVDAADFDGKAEYQFKIVAQDRTGVAFGVVTDLANSANNSLVVRVGSTQYKDVKKDIAPDENGVYKVSFVVTTVTGSAVSGSAITAADVPAGKNVVVDGFTYEVKEGDFVVSGIYNNRTIVPVTGNVTVKKSAPGITVANTEINADNASTEAAARAVLGQLNANDAKYTILDANVANTSVGTGRQYVLLRSIRVAEKIADGKWVIHTVDMNRYFSVTVQ